MASGKREFPGAVIAPKIRQTGGLTAPARQAAGLTGEEHQAVPVDLRRGRCK